MKKCVLVVLLLILSINVFSACNSSKDKALNISNDDVAYLSIFADNGKSESNILLRNYGHAFVSITNVSENILEIGGRRVLAGESITIGLWNVLEHFGVWFNIESNYISEYNKYSNRVSLTIGIGLEDIQTLNDVISSSDRWNPFFNCSTFALKMWNSVAEDNEKIDKKMITSPSYLVNEIMKFEGFEKGKEILTDKNVKYYNEG